MIYEVWVPWPEVIEHDHLIYLNETDGRLDFYYMTLEGDVLRVMSTNYKMPTKVVMIDENSDITPAGIQGKTIYAVDGCTVLKLRKQDVKTLRAEVGMFEDNFLTTTEDEDD